MCIIHHGCHPGGGKRGRVQKKKPSVSVPVAGPWAAAGARPVHKMYARPSCAKHKIIIPFLLLNTNSITLDNKKIWRASMGYRSYYRQFTGFFLNFLFVSPAFDSAPFPPARNAPFSRKFSF